MVPLDQMVVCGFLEVRLYDGYSCRLASCLSWSIIAISSHSIEQPSKRMTSTLSWVGSPCVVQSACMSPLSAELAECSLYKHIQKHKGKPDIEMSLRWAADVAEGIIM